IGDSTMTIGSALILLWIGGGVFYSLLTHWRRERDKRRLVSQRQQEALNYYQQWKEEVEPRLRYQAGYPDDWGMRRHEVYRWANGGLDHGIGHFRVAAEDSEARAATPPIPKSTQTSTGASDRKSAPRPSSRQAA